MSKLFGLFLISFAISFCGASDIFDAINNNSISDVREAIENNADLEIQNTSGLTPLMLAAYIGNLDIVELLIDSGADVNYVSKFNMTALFTAIASSNVGVLKALLDRGAKWKGVRDDNGLTPLMVASLMDSLDMFEFVLTQLNDNINAQDSNGRTALMIASDQLKNDYVRLLIDSGADVNAVDYAGRTALMLAANHMYDNDGIVKLLLDSGADKNIKDNNGMNALDFAKENDSTKVIKMLDSQSLRVADNDNGIDITDLPTFYDFIRDGKYKVFRQYIELGVDINGRANGDDTPLIVAAANGQLEMVKDLINLGADIEAQNDISATPLVLASYHGYKDIVKYLIDSGANVNAVGKSDNWTALMSAVSGDHLEIVKLLLKAGADASIVNNDGKTALDIAKEDSSASFKLLSDNDENVSNDNINTNKLESFRTAVINGDVNAVEKFLNDIDVDTPIQYDGTLSSPLLIASQLGHSSLVKLLIEHDADINFRNSVGDTPLVMAAFKGKERAASLLLKAGAKVDMADHSSQATPLMIASYQNYYGIVYELLNYGANINAVDDDGWSSLMSAASVGNDDIVHLLIDSGADVNLVNNEGKTALDLADDEVTRKTILDAGGKSGKENTSNSSNNKTSDIFAAVSSGDLLLVKELLDSGVDIDVQDSKDYTPLLLALRDYHPKIAEYLIRNGANLELQNDNDSTPLAIASFRGYLDIVELLIDSGANVNAVGKNDNWTALMSAASGDNLEIAKLLVESGADASIVNNDGKTALDIAQRDSSVKVLKYLKSLQ